MREIAERRRADIVQSHAVKSHFLVRYGGLQKRHRWIAFHHGYTAEDFKMRMYCKLDRWSLRAANRVATVCGPFADDLVRQGVRRNDIDIVPNSVLSAPQPVDADIRSIRQRLGLSDDAKIVIAVGRFSGEKAHADLLEALSIVRKENPQLNVQAVLIGDGIERPNLEARAALPDLAGHVIFAGHQRDIWPYYALADLFVLPSLSEGSPNVLLEAMSAGVPIVATAVGGVPEMIENEATGLLVPPCNPAALAAAMRRLLSSPDLGARFTSNALARIEESFSPESRYGSLVRIYERVMAAK